MSYCPKCGKEVSEEDEYCSQCRTPLKNGVSYRRVRHRSEKGEKNEKHEDDDEYGALIGGGILIWLGTLLLLQNQGILRGGDFGGFFMMGIGVILMLRGLLAYQKSGVFDHGSGFIIGGCVMLLIGAGITYNIRDWWAFLIIGLGLIIVYRGVTEQGRNPVP